jgi:DNA (cytosine-5)-methyltransferase 1
LIDYLLEKFMSYTMTAADLFAGLGGNTEGAAQAGVHVVVAANHLPHVVETHARNHPETSHYTQDLQQANFGTWPDFDLLLASPCCQGFSNARGKDKPQHDVSRSTAWAVISAAEAKKPKFLMVENVLGFRRWTLFPQWKSCLENLGYVLHENVLDAADFGVPQERERLFVTGVHRSVSDCPAVVARPGLNRVPASAIIDWEFDRRSLVNKPGRAEATLQRIANGRQQFGSRFLAPFYGSGSGTTGRSLDRPVGTITRKDRWMLVDSDRCRMLQLHENRRAMGFRDDYLLPDDPKTALAMLGNATCPPVVRQVVQTFQNYAGATTERSAA